MAAPISASVVVLHRRAAGGGPVEVYWVRRADKLAFLGGFWAFPGGRVEAVDARVSVPGADGDLAARIAAASRELREETGLDIAPSAARFVPAGRSITPEWAPVRYDATYFLVEAPAGAAPDPVAASDELTDGEWITADAALARWAAGERLTSPVVGHMLRALADGGPAGVEVQADAETWSLRAWDLLPGVQVAAVRTPTLPPATHTNCYLVGADELIVIDPASPYPEERAALDASIDALARAGRRVREIWLTHHHVDHVSGAAHLAERLGVPVAAHRVTAELLRGRVAIARELVDGQVERVAAGRGIPERRLRCVFTPGHAPGHLVFHEETTGFAIVGDMVASIGTIVVDPDEGDMGDYLASLATIAGLNPRALLPAHGMAITDPQGKLREYVEHRLWRERLIAEALAARGRATALELVPSVYTDVPAAIHPLAARSLLAHLLKLVKDGRVKRDGDAFVHVAR
jgi:glyoxylase-like metal-dependent hydrolase (beta-lactamase superfamily II)/8-oxo-dGTP pyrophosphatase MutT (NUDIX family)